MGGAAEAATPAGHPPRPPRVSLSLFFPSPSSRRLSSSFSEPSRPLPSARRSLAWVSLQGRIVGAEEASSARTIGGNLSSEEVAAWELFSPLHRVLIVAIIAVAASESKRLKKISQLERSVDLRDQVLLSMQQKLDDLCEQMSTAMDPSIQSTDKLIHVNAQYLADKTPQPGEAKFCICGHQLPELNSDSGIPPLKPKDALGIELGKDEIINGSHSNLVEQEERRMSDLSDLCPSVTSSVDIQLSVLAAEQDYYNLRKELEEKDDTIKELSAVAHSFSVAGSKRMMELEDIIRRKNLIITKLKKDMVVLEQKIIQLTRQKRKSSSASSSNEMHLPVMVTNILYDMSSTSPSSSDSDSPSDSRAKDFRSSLSKFNSQVNGITEFESQSEPSIKYHSSSHTSKQRLPKQQSASPLKQNPMKQTSESPQVSRPRQLGPSSGDFKRIRRRSTQPESRSTVPQKRWV